MPYYIEARPTGAGEWTKDPINEDVRDMRAARRRLRAYQKYVRAYINRDYEFRIVHLEKDGSTEVVA